MSVTEVIRPKAKAELRHARMLIDGSWVDSRSGIALTDRGKSGEAKSDSDRPAW